VSISDSVTPLPLDPELLGELLEKLPAWVIEQLTNNWSKLSQAQSLPVGKWRCADHSISQ
jgi:hypothetical protein